MRRRAKRRRRLFAGPAWRAVRDGAGDLRIVNERGGEPLRDECDVALLFHVYLAAAAPELRTALREAVHLLQRLVPALSYQGHRDGAILARCEAELRLPDPPMEDVLRLAHERQESLRYTEVA